MATITALLPMKGNSQRVPGKNFKMLAGRPLFQWILEELLAVPSIDRVIIDTDVVTTLENFGVSNNPRVILYERPLSLRGDEVSMNRILKNDISTFPSASYLMTHTTNPFLSRYTIQKAITEYGVSLDANLADSLFTVNEHRTRFYNEALDPINHDPKNLVQTQDLEPWFEENSCLYLFTRESFRDTSARIGRRPIMFRTPKLESVDIDTPDDWALADLIAQAMERDKQSE